MDIATVMGILMAVGLIGWTMMSGPGGLQAFIDLPSIMIVIGGTIGALMIAFPLKQFLSMAGVVKNAFFAKSTNLTKLISDLVSYAEVARRDGILALENMTKDIDDEFVVRGIQMAVDGTDPELIESILEGELESLSDRHLSGKGLFDAMGKYAPAFGMIGTLMGLIAMLVNLDDPAALGPGMAVALITTFYGALLANVFALPLSDKLAKRTQEELLAKSLIIRGVMSIQSGDNPRTVEQKLKTFLPPAERAAFEEAQNGGSAAAA